MGRPPNKQRSSADEEILGLLRQIHKDLHNFHGEDSQKLEKIMSALSDLTQAVADEVTVDDSIVTLLDGIKAQLDAAIANGNDPAALAALSATLGNEKTKIAAAVVRNTPAAP